MIIRGGENVYPREIEELPSDVRSEEMLLNMGPQHPSTHGVFQMRLTLDGETIVDLEPVMGYMHRNHDKIGERNLWLANMPYTDRLDYIAQLGNEWGYALAVEKLSRPPSWLPAPARWINISAAIRATCLAARQNTPCAIPTICGS